MAVNRHSFICPKLFYQIVKASVCISTNKVIEAFDAFFLIWHIVSKTFIIIHQCIINSSLIIVFTHLLCFLFKIISPNPRHIFATCKVEQILYTFLTSTFGETLNILNSMLHLMSQYGRYVVHIIRIDNNSVLTIFVDTTYICRQLVSKHNLNTLQVRISIEQFIVLNPIRKVRFFSIKIVCLKIIFFFCKFFKSSLLLF